MDNDKDYALSKLGEEIEALVRESGMKKSEIYRGVGLSKRTLDNYIYGIHEPGFFTMLKIRAFCTLGPKKKEWVKMLNDYGISIGGSAGKRD